MKYIPSDEIKFAAKFGFLSRGLWEKYFSKRSRTRNIRVWRSFVEAGYFMSHHDSRYADVLLLAKGAKTFLEESGLGFVSPANVYQISHDEKVAEIALKISASGKLQKFATEAELKKRNFDWKRLASGNQTIKFPDLLVHGTSGSSIALEVELSRKNLERYRKMMLSYSSQEWAQTIIFLSDKKLIFDQISKAMKEVYFPSWEKLVGFSSLKDWLEDPLQSDIFLASGKTTLARLLVKDSSEEDLGDKSPAHFTDKMCG